MSMFIEYLMRGKRISLSKAKELAGEIERECPWLDFVHFADAGVAEELVSNEVLDRWGQYFRFDDLIDWYNLSIAGMDAKSVELASKRYVELVNIVRRHGKESAYGDGEFWVVENSFVNEGASVMCSSKSMNLDSLFSDVTDWLGRAQGIDHVLFVDSDGEVFRRISSMKKLC